MRVLAAMGLAWALLVGAQNAAAQERLVIGVSQYPGALHPTIESQLVKSYILGMTRRPMTEFDAEWRLQCVLCVELPSFENGLAVKETNPDGGQAVALTYEILPEAVWGDGTPITTEDALFTWEAGRHELSGIGNYEAYRRIWKIDIHDAKRFTLHSEVLDFRYAAINDFELLPAHLERAIFEEDPAGYRNRTLYDTAPTTPGLHMGPYRIAAVEPGVHVTVERNPEWWGEEPYFDEIVARAIENTAALEANLLAGEIDMIEGSAGLPLDQALSFEKRHGADWAIQFEPGLIYEHIDLMLDNPILADGRVRRALLLGLDRSTISERLFEGRQPVAASNVHPLDWVHDEALAPAPYDPDAARALLEEAGWRAGADGVRVNDAGEPLRLELITTAGNKSRELVQQVAQSMWREIGVDLIIETEAARILFGETISKRQFPGMAMFAWISSPENAPRTTLHSEAIPSEANGWSGQNYTGYQSEAMDRLIDAVEVELDPDKRLLIWKDIQALYAEDLPALPLYFRADAHIWPTWLVGVEPTGHMAPATLGVEYWRRDDEAAP